MTEPQGLRLGAGAKGRALAGAAAPPGHSLQKAWLVLLLVVRPELDLALVASELARFVEGDGVGAIEDVIPSLRGERKHRGLSTLKCPHTAAPGPKP